MSTTFGNADAIATGNLQLKPISPSPQLKSSQAEHCQTCGRQLQEGEIKSTQLFLEQERLLGDIKKAKEELVDSLRAVNELERKKEAEKA